MGTQTLFDIVGEFEELYALAVSDDVDEQIFTDTLEALTGELEVKGAGYVAVINQLDMEAKKAKELAESFKRKADVRVNHIGRMKDALKVAMERIGTTSVNAGDYTIKLQSNGGKLPLVIDDTVPDEYYKVVYELDRDKMRKALDDGKKLKFAHYGERGTHITIK